MQSPTSTSTLTPTPSTWMIGTLSFSILEILSSISLSAPLSRKAFNWDSVFEDVLAKLGLTGSVSHLAPSLHPARFMLLPQHNESSALIFPSGLITVRSRKSNEAIAVTATKYASEIASRVSESSAIQGVGAPSIDHVVLLLHHLPQLQTALDNDILFFEKAAIRLRAGKDSHVEYEPEIICAFLIRTRNQGVIAFLPDARVCAIGRSRAEALHAIDVACLKLLNYAPVAAASASVSASIASSGAMIISKKGESAEETSVN